MSVSIQEIARHTNHKLPQSLTLRQILRLPSASFRLHTKLSPFSVMTQNMGLLVFPAPYLGTNRERAIEEIILQIKSLSPDVVGLCEVFADGERKDIFDQLRHIYPYFQEGPDQDDLDQDGGLLLLSKHSILQAHSIVFDDSVGADWWANKGVIHIRVHPPQSLTPYDIFFSHMQDIEAACGGGQQALYQQLIQMNTMVQAFSDPSTPSFIMGDLNVPGEQPGHYSELISRLGNPVDCWLAAGNSTTTGFTFVSDNNFYEDEQKKPHQNQRLDYVLLKSGSKFIPILNHIKILKFRRDNRYISDHFGLLAEFEHLVQIDF